MPEPSCPGTLAARRILPQDRIMGVLSAVTLLLEPNLGQISPYISVLAIDPRVLLGAIEKHFDPENRGNCNHANVNG